MESTPLLSRHNSQNQHRRRCVYWRNSTPGLSSDSGGQTPNPKPCSRKASAVFTCLRASPHVDESKQPADTPGFDSTCADESGGRRE
ncbi:unnamed protein product [Vitrella brassicaformis CCMP3155]|uniref:Uncharacterized protein n=1 Tax=Vitrella brassicaformis (strain CCMP3155) TaxID=1169540 RepID=A0A0G4E8W5_VITBC|nr:unnamed protein product [Vitrella brassicaformis CCMP3155]|eukprot:CEL91839.1 unnamed protein product [Vitrella brassicaformis CCMP3155]